MNYIAFGLLALGSVAMAFDLSLGLEGQPPNFTQMENFDGDQANGKWYGQYYINKGIPPLPIHCWSFVGTSGPNGSIVADVTLYDPVEHKTEMQVHVTPIPDEKAKFTMTEFTKGPLTTTMVIPGTDYESWFMKIDIFQLIGRYAYSVNVYSRTQSKMNDADLKKVNDELIRNNITDELTFVPQDCPAKSLQDKIKGFFGF